MEIRIAAGKRRSNVGKNDLTDLYHCMACTEIYQAASLNELTECTRSSPKRPSPRVLTDVRSSQAYFENVLAFLLG